MHISEVSHPLAFGWQQYIFFYLHLHDSSGRVQETEIHTWWRHQMETFSALLAICAGNSPVPVNSPLKGQWRGALMFSLICTRINGWVNNGDAGDLRLNRSHYDVTVMINLMYVEKTIKCHPLSRSRMNSASSKDNVHFNSVSGVVSM